MSKSRYMLVGLFVFFGCYAIVNPVAISSQNILPDGQQSYSVPDLIRGWGIYAVTIGLLLLHRAEKGILLACFVSSIIWHVAMVRKEDWTRHHTQSIAANTIAICLVLLL